MFAENKLYDQQKYIFFFIWMNTTFIFGASKSNKLKRKLHHVCMTNLSIFIKNLQIVNIHFA